MSTHRESFVTGAAISAISVPIISMHADIGLVAIIDALILVIFWSCLAVAAFWAATMPFQYLSHRVALLRQAAEEAKREIQREKWGFVATPTGHKDPTRYQWWEWWFSRRR